MKRFVEGEDRSQSTLFPERLDDYIAKENPVRAIDAFVGFHKASPISRPRCILIGGLIALG